MVYDRADWHSGGEFPSVLKPDNGATHIGMFLTWIIENGLISDFHLRESSHSIKLVKHREMTGREFLVKECDEKLWDEDMNEEGNAFAQNYYKIGNNFGQYFDDYESVFENYKTLYHVDDTWNNYEKLKPAIDKSFQRWKNKSY